MVYSVSFFGFSFFVFSLGIEGKKGLFGFSE